LKCSSCPSTKQKKMQQNFFKEKEGVKGVKQSPP
jgi:hypothetical protein